MLPEHHLKIGNNLHISDQHVTPKSFTINESELLNCICWWYWLFSKLQWNRRIKSKSTWAKSEKRVDC